MLRLLRFVLAFGMLAFGINLAKRKNVKLKVVKSVLCVILSLIIMIFPFENLFLKFSSPEQAFRYTATHCKIIKIVEEKNTALVIYADNDSETATLITKCDGKWKAPFWHNDQILSRLETHEIYLITKEKNSSNFYITITVDADTKTVSDNMGSVFENYSRNDYWTDYVAYVEGCNENYIINIDDKSYQIDL